MRGYSRFDVTVEQDGANIRNVTVTGLDDVSQMAWLNSEEFGPFDTSLEISQWVWRTIARHLPPS